MSNNIRTELDFDLELQKDDPKEGRALIIMVISALVLGIVCPMLILLYADAIDRFMNTLTGALTLTAIFGLIGLKWLVWRIKSML